MCTVLPNVYLYYYICYYTTDVNTLVVSLTVPERTNRWGIRLDPVGPLGVEPRSSAPSLGPFYAQYLEPWSCQP